MVNKTNTTPAAYAHAWQLFKYICVGLTSTAVDIVILQWLTHAKFFALPLSIAIAFVCGVVVNLLLHRFITFNHSKQLDLALIGRYVCVVVLNLAVAEVTILALMHFLGWSVFWAKICSLPGALLIGFTLSKYWVFKHD